MNTHPQRAWSAGVIVLVVGAALACGGISQGAAQASFVEATVALDDVAPSLERDAVAAMADEGWLRAGRGELALMDASSFKVQVEKCAGDGAITHQEALALAGYAVKFTPPPMTGPAREGQLAPKREAEAEARKKPKKPKKAVAHDFGGWDPANGVEKRGEALGWEMVSCSRGEEYRRSEACTFSAGDERVEVLLAKYDDSQSAKDDSDPDLVLDHAHVRVSGHYLFQVTSSDAAASRALADALLTEAKAGVLTLEAFKELLKAQGYRASSCNEDREGDGDTTVRCDIDHADGGGTAKLEWHPDWDLASEPQVSFNRGSIVVDLTRVKSTVRLDRPARAEQQAELLLALPAP